MDETKLRAILNAVYMRGWTDARFRSENKKEVINRAIKRIQNLLPPKIPVLEPENLAEALEGRIEVEATQTWLEKEAKPGIFKDVLDIDLKGGE